MEETHFSQDDFPRLASLARRNKVHAFVSGAAHNSEGVIIFLSDLAMSKLTAVRYHNVSNGRQLTLDRSPP